jgi:hypothetical protein
VIDDDGIGPHVPSLFVGGFFSLAGPLPVPVANIARWDGAEWHAVGTGISNVESILAVPNPVGPPTIYAADGLNGDVYQWNPAAQTWPRIGYSNGGFGITFLACLASFDEDQGGPNPPSIYFAAPGITQINNTPSRGIARYGCVPCYANCDGSVLAPALNVNDFVCFLNRFAAGDSYANCDGSTIPPAMNVNDFVCFNNRFASGCP